MKYKIGDMVKVKTWSHMKEEFGDTRKRGYLSLETFPNFPECMEKSIPKDRVIEIGDIHSANSYKIKDSRWLCSDDMIEELVVYNPVCSRFEILDL
jgi:hypothetical protein